MLGYEFSGSNHDEYHKAGFDRIRVVLFLQFTPHMTPCACQHVSPKTTTASFSCQPALMCGIPNSITVGNTTPAIEKVEEAAKFLPLWDMFLSLHVFLSFFLPLFCRLSSPSVPGVQSMTRIATVSLVLSGCKEKKNNASIPHPLQSSSAPHYVNKTTMP